MSSRPWIRMALLAVMIGFVGCDASPTEPDEPSFSHNVDRFPRADRAATVYTQNVYLGGDTGPLFTLDFSDIPAVLTATNVFWGDVQASDAPARLAEIVDEIDMRRPQVVALQEVLRFVVLDAGFSPIGGLDFLAAIEAEIAAKGLPYETAVVHEATSSTLPLGFDPSTGGISQWLNFTDRLVMLRRTDTELIATDHDAYAAGIPLGPLTVERGWARTTLRIGERPVHFVDTHLETQAAPPVQAAQAAELQAVLDALDGVVILAGDLNSNAAAEPGDPTWTPTYGSFVEAGFTDVGKVAPRSRGGRLTCCHPASLTGSQDFTQRIDFVLVRRPAMAEERRGFRGRGVPRGAFRADVVGEEPGDRTAGGLWPSDHAGLWGAISTRWLRGGKRVR